MSKIDNANAGDTLRAILDGLKSEKEKGADSKALAGRPKQPEVSIQDVLGQVSTDGFDKTPQQRVVTASHAPSMQDDMAANSTTSANNKELANETDLMAFQPGPNPYVIWQEAGGGKTIHPQTTSLTSTTGAQAEIMGAIESIGKVNRKADSSLPGDLAEISKTHEIKHISNANPPVYLASSSDNPPRLSLYDDKGKKMALGDVEEDPIAPLAIGLNNDKWLAVQTQGGVTSAEEVTDPTKLLRNSLFFDLNGANDGKLPERSDISAEGMGNPYDTRKSF